LLTVCVVLVSCVVLVDLFFLGHIQDWITQFLIYLSENPGEGDVLFVCIYVLATLFFVPPTLLMLGAGWAFAEAFGTARGILVAVFNCFLASIFGSLLSFVRARYMMRDLIHLFVKRYPIVKAADQALKRDGLRIMLLLRLCPLIPYNGLNYLGGITGLPWETFMFSLVGMLPYQIFIICMGATAGHFSTNEEESDAAEESSETTELQLIGKIILMGGGVAAFLIAMAITFRFTMKELQKELNAEGNLNDMESFIVSIRRMNIWDLEDDDMSDEEGVEVSDLAGYSIPECDEDNPPSSTRYNAMEETTQ